jgi:uncharacterized membrane protein
VGRVWPRHGRRGRPLNSVVSRHRITVSSAISFLVPCGIIAVASIPIMLNLVPPNRFYGIRTRQTVAKRELSFRANRFAGISCFIAAGASAAVFAIHPEYSSGRSFIGLLVFVVPLVTALGASFAYVRRVGGGGKR